MELALNSTLVLLPVLYTLLVVAYARAFARRRGWLAANASLLLVVTVGLHFLQIALRGLEIGGCPLASRWDFFSLIGLAVAVTYLILELRIGDRSTGIFILTLAFALVILTAIFTLGGEGTAVRMGVRSSLHSFGAVVGFSAVAVSSIYAVLYLFLYRAIKIGRFGDFYRRMPPLETLSRLNMQATLVGFVALSVTVAVGVWELRTGARAGPDVHFTSPVVFLTVLVWLLYGSCLVAHRLGLGAKRLAYSTLLAVPLMVPVLVLGIIEGRFHG